ncbi:MAG: RNase adapter RapZ [Deltaproteobacteria bacterium]
MQVSDPHVVLVTGPSGAGRTTAINALEDIGFETISNMPLTLLPKLLESPPLGRSLALGVDVRNRDYSTDALLELIERLSRTDGLRTEVLFLDCRADVLVKRYSETRRRHPLAPEDDPEYGITRELDLLVPIRARADYVIDTSETSIHDLRHEITTTFGREESLGLALSVQSFSYKRGIPRGVDVVFDCRFLRNPHWETALRAKDGRSGDVAAYVADDPRYDAFIAKVSDLILFLVPASRDEGKSHLTFAFGCTGGQHRSVAVTETIAIGLADANLRVSIRHRELEQRRGAGQPIGSVGVSD